MYLLYPANHLAAVMPAGVAAQVLQVCEGQQYCTRPSCLGLDLAQDLVLGLAQSPYSRTSRQVVSASAECASWRHSG